MPRTIRLPLGLDVYRHPNEREGKTTSVHAKLIAPEDTNLYVEDFVKSEAMLQKVLQRYPDPSRILLLFPSLDSEELQNLPRNSFDRLIVIDGTWKQARSMCWTLVPYGFKPVRIGGGTDGNAPLPRTLFWRHQTFGDHCLATIEAIYWFYREFEDVHGNGNNSSNSISSSSNPTETAASSSDTIISRLQSHARRGPSQFDQLLFYFKYQYELIQRVYKKSGKPFTARKHNSETYIVAG